MKIRQLLTIAIPTYNRPDQLRRCLEALGPQLTNQCRVFISDNDSKTPAYSIALQIFEKFEFKNFEICKRVANVGAGGNLLYCIEKTNTEWIWLLSDDNPPSPQAITYVLRAIVEFDSAAAINFASGITELKKLRRPQLQVLNNIREVANSLDSFSNLLFMSATVHRTKALHSSLRLGYQTIHTFGPHLAMLFNGLEHGQGALVLHPFKLVDWECPAPIDWWSPNVVVPNLNYICDVVKDPDIRRKLAKKCAAEHPLIPVNCGMMEAMYCVYKYWISDSGAVEKLEWTFSRLKSRLAGGAPPLDVLCVFLTALAAWVLNPVVFPLLQLKRSIQGIKVARPSSTSIAETMSDQRL